MGRRRRRPARAAAPHRRPLRFEPLEDRRLLAVVTVDTDQDVVDFNDGVTSLREAIFAANTIAGPDTIEFAESLTTVGPATILLTQGELVITDSLTINGPGAERLTVDAQGNSGVFRVTLGADAVINGINITGGEAVLGGGIYSDGNLSLSHVKVSGNRATQGGGIYVVGGGTTVVEDSEVSRNEADRYGGIAQTYGTLELRRSSVVANSASYVGGVHFDGFTQSSATLVIEASTIAENTAAQNSGGLRIVDANSSIVNTTISGNKAATALGGGVLVSMALPGREVTFENVTIIENDGGEFSPNYGGGLAVIGNLSTNVRLSNSIVAGNTGQNGAVPSDVSGAFDLASAYNLIGAIDGSTGLDTADSGTLFGTAAAPQNAGLGPLGQYGGPTSTHALLPGSPAIDAGDPSAVAGESGVPEFDQRGAPFVRVANGDDVPEARIDMGAVEWQPNPLPGDYNRNGVVDAADYSVWRDTLGSTTNLRADGSSPSTPGTPDGVVDEHDYAFWVENFGNVLAEGAGSRELGAGSGELGAGSAGPATAGHVRGPKEVAAVPASGSSPAIAKSFVLPSVASPSSTSPRTVVRRTLAAERVGDGLLALLARRPDDEVTNRERAITTSLDEPSDDTTDEPEIVSLDEAFAAISAAV